MKSGVLTVAILAAMVGMYAVLADGQTEETRQEISGQVIRIVDGDGLYIAGHEPQIRLWGIDAPERNEIGYHASGAHLESLVLGEEITCEIMDVDRYGRTVGRCHADGAGDIGAVMIKDGQAEEFLRYSNGYYSR